MRYFNTLGPVDINEHYVVERRELQDQLLAQIEKGKYFTIFAPRQMGKTTLLRNLVARLSTRPDYLPITLSFEAYESWSESAFWSDFGTIICEEVEKLLDLAQPPSLVEIRSWLSSACPHDYQTFWDFFRQFHRWFPASKVVLILDEFDATPQPVLSPLLQIWRRMYLERAQRPHGLHSIGVIGIQNIAKLNFGRSSPFNIASQLRLAEFSLAEVKNLLAQYSEETGQAFAPEVVEKLYKQTEGHPFLVNRVAAIMTEDIVTDRATTIQLKDLRKALHQLRSESNYNFETVLRHANPHQNDLLRIMFGAEYTFTLNNPLVAELYRFGIIRQSDGGICRIANPIYQEILLDAFTPLQAGLQRDLLVNGHDFRPYVVNGSLQMGRLLSQFRQFVERRGRAAFQVTPMPQEATGQYLLMGYLDAVMRHVEGDIFSEVPSGEGRLDLIASHRGQRFVIETKIWRGPVEFERGLGQLADYLESEGVQIGYFVVFHARPTVYGQLEYAELEFAQQVAGKQIYVYLVRLGEIIGEQVDAA